MADDSGWTVVTHKKSKKSAPAPIERKHDAARLAQYIVAYETEPIAVDDGIIGREIVFDGQVIIRLRHSRVLNLVSARHAIWQCLHADQWRIGLADVNLCTVEPLVLPLDPERFIKATIDLDD